MSRPTAHVLRAMANHALAAALAKNDPGHPALQRIAQVQALDPVRFK